MVAMVGRSRDLKDGIQDFLNKEREKEIHLILMLLHCTSTLEVIYSIATI